MPSVAGGTTTDAPRSYPEVSTVRPGVSDARWANRQARCPPGLDFGTVTPCPSPTQTNPSPAGAADLTVNPLFTREPLAMPRIGCRRQLRAGGRDLRVLDKLATAGGPAVPVHVDGASGRCDSTPPQRRKSAKHGS